VSEAMYGLAMGLGIFTVLIFGVAGFIAWKLWE
jgi:hypothetical protein